MKRRRWYKINAASACADWLIAGMVIVTNGKPWAAGLCIALGIFAWSAYSNGKRTYEARRKEAARIVEWAKTQTPEQARTEGSFMRVEAEGFVMWLEYHDECWVETKRRPPDGMDHRDYHGFKP